MEFPESISKGWSWRAIILNSNIYIPLIITVLLAISSFVPLLQVILLELFQLYVPISSAIGVGQVPFFFFVNISLSIFILYLFYRSENKLSTLASQFLAVVFLYPVLIYLFQGFSSESLYMIPFILAAVLYGTIFISIGTFKVQADLQNNK